MTNRRELTDSEKAAAERLKEQFRLAKEDAKARGEKLTQEIIAERCGWSGQSIVSQYMRGRLALNLEAAAQLARALNIPLERISPELASKAKTPQFLGNTSSPLPKPGRIPVLSWDNAGCWPEPGGQQAVGDVEEWIVFGDENTNKNAYALRVQGESMLDPAGPVSFSEGDMIIVDPDKTPENRSLVVVRQSGSSSLVFKQLIIESGERLLKALNPSWPNRIVPMTDDTILCGVVIARYTTF